MTDEGVFIHGASSDALAAWESSRQRMLRGEKLMSRIKRCHTELEAIYRRAGFVYMVCYEDRGARPVRHTMSSNDITSDEIRAFIIANLENKLAALVDEFDAVLGASDSIHEEDEIDERHERDTVTKPRHESDSAEPENLPGGGDAAVL